eukprot:GHVU01182778.1.p3 GENE.GHVU01182778.1~~GHVU01182778.1.p3  ORF type:complete len:118 (-),score=16.21 GHVU01182778.1:909-1262(-)
MNAICKIAEQLRDPFRCPSPPQTFFPFSVFVAVFFAVMPLASYPPYTLPAPSPLSETTEVDPSPNSPSSFSSSASSSSCPASSNIIIERFGALGAAFRSCPSPSSLRRPPRALPVRG